MKIPLTEYFIRQQSQHSQAVNGVRQRREEIQRQAKEALRRRDSLLEQRRQRERLLQSANPDEREVLQRRVSELDLEIAAVDDTVAKLQSELGCLTEPDFDQEKRKILTTVLKQVYSCEEAESVDLEEDFWSRFPLELGPVDGTGRVTTCRVSLDRDEQRWIRIDSTEPRFKKGFRPSEYSWIPDALCDEVTVAPNTSWPTPRIAAFIDSEHRLILSRNCLQWQVEERKPAARYGEADKVEFRPCEEDFSDLADALSARFDVVLGKPATVDLGTQYDHALMRRVQTFVLDSTTTTPSFAPNQELSSSDVIFAAIKEDWLALKRAPWSKAINGELALLKYHLENEETPRFWSEEFAHCYGFRLRTRDHSWLVGSICLLPSRSTTKTESKIQVHHGGYRCVAQIGRMWILVEQQR